MRLREYFKSSSFLSFIRGMGSLNIMGGSYYNSKPSWMRKDLTFQEQDALAQEQDALAIKKDWEVVGNDINQAIINYKKSLITKIED